VGQKQALRIIATINPVVIKQGTVSALRLLCYKQYFVLYDLHEITKIFHIFADDPNCNMLPQSLTQTTAHKCHENNN